MKMSGPVKWIVPAKPQWADESYPVLPNNCQLVSALNLSELHHRQKSNNGAPDEERLWSTLALFENSSDISVYNDMVV